MGETPVTVYIGLGSNLENPQQQLHTAVEALQQIPATQLQHCSPFYRSKPMGPQDQPDYINAVAALTTTLTPLALLDALQRIENAQGRVRKERWGARTLDLDILLFGAHVLDEPRLTVPHPGLCQRSFVVFPLLDISPDLTLPDGRPLAACLAELDDDLERI